MFDTLTNATTAKRSVTIELPNMSFCCGFFLLLVLYVSDWSTRQGL